jgi:hypothetical protein
MSRVEETVLTLRMIGNRMLVRLHIAWLEYFARPAMQERHYEYLDY